jgi:hypothetical protein
MFKKLQQTLASLILASSIAHATPSREVEIPATHLLHENDRSYSSFLQEILRTHYTLIGIAFDNLPSTTKTKRAALIGGLSVVNAWVTGVAHEFAHYERKEIDSFKPGATIGILPKPEGSAYDHSYYELGVQVAVPFYFHDTLATKLHRDLFSQSQDVDDGVNFLINRLSSPLYSAVLLIARQGNLVSDPGRVTERKKFYDQEAWAMFFNGRHSSYTVFNGEKNDWMQEHPGRIKADATHVALLDVGLSLFNAETYNAFEETFRYINTGERSYKPLNMGSKDVRISPPSFSLALTPYGAIPSIEMLFGIGDVTLSTDIMFSLESTQKARFGTGKVYRQQIGINANISDQISFSTSFALSEYANGSNHPEPLGFESSVGIQFPIYAGVGLRVDGTVTYNDLNASSHLSEHDILETLCLGNVSVVYRIPN